MERQLLNAENQALFSNFKRHNSIATATTAVLGNVQCAAHLETVTNLSHQNNGVGIRQFVTTFDRTTQKFIQQNFVRCVQQHRGNLAVVIQV